MTEPVRITEGKITAENIILKGTNDDLNVTEGCVTFKAGNIILDGNIITKEEK